MNHIDSETRFFGWVIAGLICVHLALVAWWLVRHL
jgi:hypothetical protein